MNRSIHVVKIAILSALALLAIGCSELNAPTASQSTDAVIESVQYPPVEDVLAIVEAAGYRVIDMSPASALDDNCDSVSTSRLCRTTNQTNLQISGLVRLEVPGSVLPYNMDITITAPASCFGVADFYPHPTQFNGNVTIIWDVRAMNLPSDFDFTSIVPLYVHDDGTIEEVTYHWDVEDDGEVNYERLFVQTNHFSRYIITSRLLF
jgi:hypothetical protein